MNTLDQNTHALRNASARRLGYIVTGDTRSLEIQDRVIDRLLDERRTLGTTCKHGHPGAVRYTVQTAIGDTTAVQLTRCAPCDLLACTTCRRPVPPTAAVCTCGGRTWATPAAKRDDGKAGANA